MTVIKNEVAKLDIIKPDKLIWILNNGVTAVAVITEVMTNRKQPRGRPLPNEP